MAATNSESDSAPAFPPSKTSLLVDRHGLKLDGVSAPEFLYSVHEAAYETGDYDVVGAAAYERAPCALERVRCHNASGIITHFDYEFWIDELAMGMKFFQCRDAEAWATNTCVPDGNDVVRFAFVPPGGTAQSAFREWDVGYCRTVGADVARVARAVLPGSCQGAGGGPD